MCSVRRLRDTPPIHVSMTFIFISFRSMSTPIFIPVPEKEMKFRIRRVVGGDRDHAVARQTVKLHTYTFVSSFYNLTDIRVGITYSKKACDCTF